MDPSLLTRDNRSVVCQFQGSLLVGNVSVLIRYNNERTVDEDSVGHVLSYLDATLVVKLYVAYPGLYRHGDVPYSRIQPDVLDLAKIAEERLHLVLGSLRSDVRHLNDFRRSNRHFGSLNFLCSVFDEGQVSL